MMFGYLKSHRPHRRNIIVHTKGFQSTRHRVATKSFSHLLANTSRRLSRKPFKRTKIDSGSSKTTVQLTKIGFIPLKLYDDRYNDSQKRTENQNKRDRSNVKCMAMAILYVFRMAYGCTSKSKP